MREGEKFITSTPGSEFFGIIYSCIVTFGDNDSGGIVSDYFIIGGPGMDSNTVTISELISRILAEARRLGMSEATIWRDWEPKANCV